MKKFNADDPGLFEGIEVTINGQEYTVDEVTEDMLEEIEKAGKNDNSATLSKQLSILLKTDQDKFKKTDIRKMSKTIKYITDHFTDDINANPTTAG